MAKRTAPPPPVKTIQRVNVDFPTAILQALDREATRMGVTRQALIKIRIADWLPKSAGTGRPE